VSSVVPLLSFTSPSPYSEVFPVVPPASFLWASLTEITREVLVLTFLRLNGFLVDLFSWVQGVWNPGGQRNRPLPNGEVDSSLMSTLHPFLSGLLSPPCFSELCVIGVPFDYFTKSPKPSFHPRAGPFHDDTVSRLAFVMNDMRGRCPSFPDYGKPPLFY